MVKLHFLNVGKGSCAWIEFRTRLGIIDIDDVHSRNDSTLTDPIWYYESHFAGRSVFRFILTHPDMDHMSGLDRLAGATSIKNFWDTINDKKIGEGDWFEPYKQEDWDRYQEFRTSQQDPKCLRLYRDETSDCCWVEDGLTILSPTPALDQKAGDSEDYNHNSYVIMQEHAGIKVLHGGDATPAAWDSMLEDLGADRLKANVLVAPHHGSEHSVHPEALRAVEPEWVIVSLDCEAEYDEDFYTDLATRGVLTTCERGNIVVEIDDNGNCQVFVDKN